ncbi:MAG: GGDEF domain-containing protein [Actinomycetia bacterium]|nr:GGDEF domain-containing protein [Actinomycetes bacterium]
MIVPIRLRDFLIISISLCLVLVFLYFSKKAYLLWFLVFIPIFLAGWVWHRAGAFLVGVVTLVATSTLIYMEIISKSVEIDFPSLFLQLSLGFALIFIGGLGVGKISQVADLEKEIIKQITLKDKATDLFTEKYFQLRLEDEIKRSERFEISFCLLLISVDSLFDYRNTFGIFHTDILLRKIARLMEQCVREIDIVARHRDGFAIILLRAKSHKAMEVAERIRKTIERTEFEGDEVDPQVKKTISIGLAQYPKDAFDENGLLIASQKALIEAIEKGGNQIAFCARSLKEVRI